MSGGKPDVGSGRTASFTKSNAICVVSKGKHSRSSMMAIFPARRTNGITTHIVRL